MRHRQSVGVWLGLPLVTLGMYHLVVRRRSGRALRLTEYRNLS
ncbi:hypothetical protein JOF29_007904 [Kribbella aluminosa]|uniref:Uncharacterized protein n=1 Tax=Kribbella aluminosa TaxID=416017 RepID=A0ABS4UYT1_9ACTN|nr:hypothetical protein [Kribbella aluminosa]MBP2356794.1 hypothetical protein [Kribbella aluminosa]